MDYVGRALIAVDRYFHAEDDAQEFSERLFYNVGRFYSFGMLLGGLRGLCHRSKPKIQTMDAITDYAWRSSLSAASAAFLYTPLEASLRKQVVLARPLSEDIAWGTAWALTRRRWSLGYRLGLGCAVGLGHSALRQYGPLAVSRYADGKRLAQLWKWRLSNFDKCRATAHRLLSKDRSADQCEKETKVAENAVL